MPWENIVAALAAGTLGVYLIRRAPDLVEDERALVRFGDGYARMRLWSHRLGGLLMLGVAIALLVGGAIG